MVLVMVVLYGNTNSGSDVGSCVCIYEVVVMVVVFRCRNGISCVLL